MISLKESIELLSLVTSLIKKRDMYLVRPITLMYLVATFHF
jgi:hypothetical protein